MPPSSDLPDLPDCLPGGMPVDTFLRDWWRKKPLLIRNAFPDFESPITPEELAGLALEEEAASRLIMERGGEYPWQLRHGPFQEEDFADLPASHWTLLVQEVDRWVPGVAALFERFLFVSSWRFDDIMVSYAPDGGNVGAHVDRYDVFLIQTLGRREWRIGAKPLPAGEEVSVPDIDVDMLADFEPDAVLVLEEGDMLYLPPRVAHHGIALGPCMTFSIGFRAPGHAECLDAVLRRAIVDADPLGDCSGPELTPPDHPGRIGAEVLEQVYRTVRDTLTDTAIAESFGALVTESRRGEELPLPEQEWTGEELAEALRAGAELVRVAPNRFAFIEHGDGHASLFVHGEAYPLEPGLAYAAPLIAGREPLDAETLGEVLEDEDLRELLAVLVNAGCVEVCNDIFTTGVRWEADTES